MKLASEPIERFIFNELDYEDLLNDSDEILKEICGSAIGNFFYKGLKFSCISLN